MIYRSVALSIVGYVLLSCIVVPETCTLRTFLGVPCELYT